METGKYLIIHISVVTIILYLFTFIIYQNGIIKKQTHRKIWNSILLVMFLISAVIGLIAVVKINYKLTIPIYDALLKYHVEAGIILAITGILHLTWHFTYYLKIFRTEKSIQTKSTFEWPSLSDKQSILLLFFTGLISTCSQIIFLKEFYSVFFGNELVFGIVLSLWLVFSGLGAYSARKQFKPTNLNNLLRKFIYLLWFLVFIIIIIFTAKNIFFIQGQQVNLTGIFIFTTLILMIPCFLFGYLFSILSAIYSKNQNRIGKAYSIETFGSITGGILINFILVFIFNSFQIIAFIILTGHILLILGFNIRLIKLCFPVTIFFVVLLLFPSTNERIRQTLYKPFVITKSEVIPSGNIDFTEYEGQSNIYFNNVLHYFTENKMVREEEAHYAMLLHSNPKSILVISDAFNGIVNEITKYPGIENTDIVETDKWYSKAMQKEFNTDTIYNNVNIINEDPIKYINYTNKRYDVILVNVPSPMSLLYNRFYSVEFFRASQSILNKDGIMAISYSAGINYLDDYEKNVMGLIFNSVKKAFQNCRIVPGNKYFFIASDSNVEKKYVPLFSEKNIQNEYVNEYYVNDMIIEQRSEMILNDIHDIELVNNDLLPRAFLNQIRIYMKYNKWGYSFLGIILSVVFAGLFIFQNNIRRGLLLTGFTGISIELITIFMVQILLGNAFYISGIIITVFLLFIAFGARLYNKVFPENRIQNFEKLILILGAVLFFIYLMFKFLYITNASDLIIYPVFTIIIAVTGFLTGSVFTKATMIDRSSIIINTSGNYSSDLAGASLGAIITTVYLVPLLGILNTVIILGTILILYSVVSLLLNKNF